MFRCYTIGESLFITLCPALLFIVPILILAPAKAVRDVGKGAAHQWWGARRGAGGAGVFTDLRLQFGYTKSLRLGKLGLLVLDQNLPSPLKPIWHQWTLPAPSHSKNIGGFSFYQLALYHCFNFTSGTASSPAACVKASGCQKLLLQPWVNLAGIWSFDLICPVRTGRAQVWY